MIQNEQAPVFDRHLIQRFDVSGPRYTSYPTADRFNVGFGRTDLARHLGLRAQGGLTKPLSLYFHIPFCDTVCFYCACNKIVTKDRSRAERYLAYLDKEMALASSLLVGSREVAQMHWGGGTPTFLSDDEIRRLFLSIRRYFTLKPGGEYSIEVDPRRVSADTVALLGQEGFNRMSVGVQDFDPTVQAAVNRIQSVAETASVIDAARANGFRSVSVDLIYGLPFQNVERVSRTLDQVLALAPDRLALYNYAHLPTRFMPQRRINATDLPAADEKLEILGMAIEKLTAAGYVFIGMDHFAKPDDEMAAAQRKGRLYRNFQGYSTHSDCDLLGFGVSAIGKVGPAYAQNAKTLEAYYEALDRDELPVVRGYEMTLDDQLRYAVIQSLMCHFVLDFDAFEEVWAIDFASYFADEIAELRERQRDGLCVVEDRAIVITTPGRMLARVLVMVFDAHLRQSREAARYSKVI
ncbi:oxygen-independent coproporphyrinogen III oxidase [Niveibacterium sp. 24ML]|uniref:oxygen-independent coproporphyrinogen III oxidase n=1 Tax=Niveibacterium sp. 24ML TaxID=2985512 RepID=UPI0022712C49|nr:oxygen-independent coproporphyrinogen III oxidase [Niveibacterium sp. 24ML]MCX9157033.1 oxygen-independent coproporphyrinogen III oxidase [Niveibacterium sp. 24ML]